jgi:hypothetical protein
MHPPRVEQLIYVAHALGLYARKRNHFETSSITQGVTLGVSAVHTGCIHAIYSGVVSSMVAQMSSCNRNRSISIFESLCLRLSLGPESQGLMGYLYMLFCIENSACVRMLWHVSRAWHVHACVGLYQGLGGNRHVWGQYQELSMNLHASALMEIQP